MDSELVIALISLFVGWFLSQLTDIWKEKWNVRNLKRALLAELTDIQTYAERATKYCDQFIEDIETKKVGHITPQPLKTLIYENYYALMYTSFHASEREAISTIYCHIDNLNKHIKGYTESDKFSSFANMYSSALWVIACIERYQSTPRMSISSDQHKVKQVNDMLQSYVTKLESFSR